MDAIEELKMLELETSETSRKIEEAISKLSLITSLYLTWESCQRERLRPLEQGDLSFKVLSMALFHLQERD